MLRQAACRLNVGGIRDNQRLTFAELTRCPVSTSIDMKLLPYHPIQYPVRLDNQHGLAPKCVPAPATPAGWHDRTMLRLFQGNAQTDFRYDARRHQHRIDPAKIGGLIDIYV